MLVGTKHYGRDIARQSQGEVRAEKLFKHFDRYAPYAIGAATIGMLWLWSIAIQPLTYTKADLDAYATHYLNEVLHSK